MSRWAPVFDSPEDAAEHDKLIVAEECDRAADAAFIQRWSTAPLPPMVDCWFIPAEPLEPPF